MRDKQVSSLYFIVFVKKISACLQINTDVFFYKNHDGELRDMSRNYPRIIFFDGVIMGHHFRRYSAALHETDFTFRKFITCLSLLAKQISHY